ncbi:ead/Ea22-like family protein [Escherichia coli]|nr:ead/Ea22-like family protein [Escherichia coli]
MSKIDYQALREAAEKATPGNWWIDSHGQAMVSFIDNEVLEVFVTDNKRDAVRHEDTGNLSRWRNDNDATFIATANPATVLALLDELERNQQYIKRRDQENEDIALTVGKLRVELETAKSKLNEQREYYEGIISDGSKRIAKLESNEVREDGNQFLVVRHPGKTPVIKHCTGDLEEFLRQLIEQDPLVTIDIITHRYYGVGGQWVQDAGEYLHMMSDAGIRIKGE